MENVAKGTAALEYKKKIEAKYASELSNVKKVSSKAPSAVSSAVSSRLSGKMESS